MKLPKIKFKQNLNLNFDFNLNLDISLKEKAMLVVLGLVAIVFIGTQVLIVPAAETLSTDTATLAATQLKVEQTKAEVAGVEGSAKIMANTLASAKKAAYPLLPSADKPTLHVFLLGIVKSCGLTVQSATISDPTAATPAAETAETGASTTVASEQIPYTMKTYADAYLGKSSAASSAASTTSSASSASSASTTSSATSTTSSAASSASSTSSAASSPTASNATGGDSLMVSVDLQVTGSYANANKLMDKLKKTNRYIIITSFNCTKSGNSCTCNITLDCYAAEKLDGSDHIFDWKLTNPAGQKSLM